MAVPRSQLEANAQDLPLWRRTVQRTVSDMSASEPLGQEMQIGIVAALRLYFGNSGEDIVQVRPG